MYVDPWKWSLGGSRYFVTFIDDASRKLWVYFLRTKDEVFKYFKRFHAMVERQTGKPLKCLRSDNGGEYSSHEFKNYCPDHGIRHEKTVPGTPQHNGMAERINRTIMEKVRYDMLIVGQDMKLIGDLKKDLANSFDMKDLGPANQILGMQIKRKRKSKRLWLSQERQSALDLSKNAMYHSRTKHIDVRYHWLRQAVEEQQFKLEKIHIDENPADMMTKVITGGKLQLCVELIGMVCM
ncbi:Unknown protein [Striga hermonthica]|uniref:Integrase catalytic domain-containing protein n=1 Tax=Striga hermonthica TaxID=68872 RepID=A0A9N7RLN6_STRHE|nr:Unknown protein [Striga hermonthica]